MQQILDQAGEKTKSSVLQYLDFFSFKMSIYTGTTYICSDKYTCFKKSQTRHSKTRMSMFSSSCKIWQVMF